MAKHGIGFGAHRVIEVRERRQIGGLALAREDRQRHIVERGQVVEQVDDLEAARDSRLDALGHGGYG